MNGLPVLSRNDKLDIFSKNASKQTSGKYLESGAKGLILDFKGITFVDSVGLGILAIAVKTFQKVKGRVILVNPQEQGKSIFLEMNLGKRIPM